MSQKYIKSQNNNSHSRAYQKYYAQAVYDKEFVGTDELAEYIQNQASVKKSDIKATLQELGEAMKHFFELGQKIRLDNIGIFKVGFSSIGVANIEDCNAATITTRRVLFQPKRSRIVVHCSATREDHPYPVTALIADHRQRFGFTGYHYYVARDEYALL